MVYAIVLFLLGVLAASSVIVKSKPNAQELIDKLVPIQGWLGFVACIWGVIGIIQAVLGLGMLTSAPIWWITWLATSIVTASLGLLLGFSLLSKFILSKNEAAMAKGEALRMKLAGYQIPLGLIAIGLAIWGLAFQLFLYKIL